MRRDTGEINTPVQVDARDASLENNIVVGTRYQVVLSQVFSIVERSRNTWAVEHGREWYENKRRRSAGGFQGVQLKVRMKRAQKVQGSYIRVEPSHTRNLEKRGSAVARAWVRACSKHYLHSNIIVAIWDKLATKRAQFLDEKMLGREAY